MIQIPLTQGRFALIDESDQILVSPYKWHAVRYGKQWYARAWVKGESRNVYLHRLILREPAFQVDHADGNGLNCQRRNLRAANSSLNGANRGKQANNTSGYKGVFWSPRHKKWYARLGIAGRGLHLGYFASPVEASEAYHSAAQICFSEFAYENVVPHSPTEMFRHD